MPKAKIEKQFLESSFQDEENSEPAQIEKNFKNPLGNEIEISSPIQEETGSKGPADSNSPDERSVIMNHKTQFERYYRAGIVLKQLPDEFRVTREQLDILETDEFVEIHPWKHS